MKHRVYHYSFLLSKLINGFCLIGTSRKINMLDPTLRLQLPTFQIAFHFDSGTLHIRHKPWAGLG